MHAVGQIAHGRQLINIPQDVTQGQAIKVGCDGDIAAAVHAGNLGRAGSETDVRDIHQGYRAVAAGDRQQPESLYIGPGSIVEAYPDWDLAVVEIKFCQSGINVT